MPKPHGYATRHLRDRREMRLGSVPGAVPGISPKLATHGEALAVASVACRDIASGAACVPSRAAARSSTEPGRCDAHRRPGFNWQGPRLAGYDSARWKSTSRRIRRERPTCERCGDRPSEHGHHRRHLRWPDPRWFDPDELEALYAECHRTVTGRHAAMVKQGRAS
jgi:5-methylcytosine-specific restriction endonuclease McrA